MSVPPELLRLVSDLRREIQTLRTEVVQLEGRVVELESQQVASKLDSEFDLVSSVASGTASAYPTLPVARSISPTRDLSTERVQAAFSIGQFLRRCLSGAPRGLSGRERIAAPSSVYIVCQSFDRVVFDPPKVFFAWGETKSLVIRNGSPGPSIFVGVPTVAEARIAVEAAGCSLPAALQQ